MSQALQLTPEACERAIVIAENQAARAAAFGVEPRRSGPWIVPEILRKLSFAYPLVFESMKELGDQFSYKTSSTFTTNIIREASGQLVGLKMFETPQHIIPDLYEQMLNEINVASLTRQIPETFESPLDRTSILVDSNLNHILIKSKWRLFGSLLDMSAPTRPLCLKYYVKAYFGLMASHGLIQLDASMGNAFFDYGELSLTESVLSLRSASNAAYPVKIGDAGRIVALSNPNATFVPYDSNHFHSPYPLPLYMDQIFEFVCSISLSVAQSYVPRAVFARMWTDNKTISEFVATHREDASFKSICDSLLTIPDAFRCLCDVFGRIYRDLVCSATLGVGPDRWGLASSLSADGIQRLARKFVNLEDFESEFFTEVDLKDLHRHFSHMKRRMELQEWNMFDLPVNDRFTAFVSRFLGAKPSEIQWSVSRFDSVDWVCCPCPYQPLRPSSSLIHQLLYSETMSATANNMIRALGTHYLHKVTSTKPAESPGSKRVKVPEAQSKVLDHPFAPISKKRKAAEVAHESSKRAKVESDQTPPVSCSIISSHTIDLADDAVPRLVSMEAQPRALNFDQTDSLGNQEIETSLFNRCFRLKRNMPSSTLEKTVFSLAMKSDPKPLVLGLVAEVQAAASSLNDPAMIDQDPYLLSIIVFGATCLQLCGRGVNELRASVKLALDSAKMQLLLPDDIKIRLIWEVIHTIIARLEDSWIRRMAAQTDKLKVNQ